MTKPKYLGLKKRSLKRRVALITISCSLISVLLVLMTAYKSLTSDIENLLTREQIIESRRLASAVNQELEVRALALSSLASVLTDGEKLLSEARLQETLNRQKNMKALFSPGLIVFDADATAIVEDTYVPGRIGTNYRDRPHFIRVVKNRQPTISRPIIGRATGAPLLSFLAPIQTDDGDLLGVVSGFINLSKKSILPANQRSDQNQHDQDSLQIIDTSNMVYVSGNRDGLHLQPLPAPGENRLIDAALSGISFGTADDGTGTQQIYAASHLQRLGWLFVKTTPYQQAIAPARASFQRFLIWSLAGASLLALVGFWLTQRRRKLSWTS